MADAVEHRTRPHHPAADCRYLRFATTRQGSPAEPIATGSGRYFTACFSRNQLKLFNVVWLDATMTACLPTWFNSQRRRATPTFTTTSAQSGRRCRSRGHALGTGASTRRASKSLQLDDWPDHVPVTEAELDLFEVHFGPLLDELLGSKN